MAGQLELTFVTFKQNSLITVEGKADTGRFFIIHEGKARISKETELVAEEGGNIRGPGDFFGVVSAMSSQSQIETVQAATDLSLISVRRDQYGEFIHQHPKVAVKIMLDFSRRLRYLDEALSRLALKGLSAKDSGPAHLFEVGEYYARQGSYPQAYYAYHRYLRFCPEGEHAAPARRLMEGLALKAGPIKLNQETAEDNRTYLKDSMFFAEGEPGDEFYIILKGAVKISKIENNQEVLLAVLRGGDIFGEMAMLERKPRTANAVAHEDCVVMVVNGGNFERTVREQPQIVARLTILQAERLWFIYKQLGVVLVRDPLGRMYEMLKIHLERNRIDLKGNRAHLFGFGPRELAGMAGLSPAESRPVLERLLGDKHISLVKDQIFTEDLSEIVRQANYFRTMQKLDHSRRMRPGPR